MKFRRFLAGWIAAGRPVPAVKKKAREIAGLRELAQEVQPKSQLADWRHVDVIFGRYPWNFLR
jgi:hypothetical protein